jgi:hypothetical protein
MNQNKILLMTFHLDPEQKMKSNSVQCLKMKCGQMDMAIPTFTLCQRGINGMPFIS